MAQININIRVDENVKNEFALLCDNLGLSVSSACVVFMRKAISEQKIPFELSANKPIEISADSLKTYIKKEEPEGYERKDGK